MENLHPLFFIGAVVVLLLMVLYFLPIGLWFAATVSGVRISLMELLLMRLRKTPVKEVVEGLIVATKGGLNLSRDELEALALSGGDVKNVVNGMVAAKRAGFPLSFENAVKADAQGLNILESVQEKMRETQKVQFE
ncbi:flotillin-like FloA family protein [Maribellus sp. CM-23]|uniref:flotillin-like FloA family protein n=1 Tax=Maribellus sp. CM-23 TaxID=2781026 RepID=UPI001F26AFA4|nr:flotillin-like FloA family protein [Maribellus sp. CM-23]MCE4565728.1 flotillin-like FloA family protein [Maribellus sp. CM-23]